jgi:hypothetical protein
VVKNYAEKEYPKIDRKEYFKSLNEKFKNELKFYMESKKKKEERKSLSKMKKMVSMRQTILAKDNLNTELDLDIFVRYLFEEINKLRVKPAETLKILDEYIEILNNPDESFFNPNNVSVLDETFSNKNNPNFVNNMNGKFEYVYAYINHLVSNKITLPPFEWDNDLSNSAEDYLKICQGKVERDMKTYLNHMKEIINTNYYSEYKNISSINYQGLPETAGYRPAIDEDSQKCQCQWHRQVARARALALTGKPPGRPARDSSLRLPRAGLSACHWHSVTDGASDSRRRTELLVRKLLLTF